MKTVVSSRAKHLFNWTAGFAAVAVLFVAPIDSAGAAAAKSYRGIVARQTTSWGIYEIKACERGIRIAPHNGAVLIACPPDWTIYIFRKGQKRAAKIPYEKFRTKNQNAVKLSSIKAKALIKLVAGIKATQFNFRINQRLADTTMGGLYRTRETQPLVMNKEVVFAPNIETVPKKAKGIWSNFFEIPIFEEIPMQIILHLKGGETRAYFDTKSMKEGNMTDADFAVPSGLSYTAQFAEMIYGQETEGVADLLYP